jgi:hypothetical protein
MTRTLFEFCFWFVVLHLIALGVSLPSPNLNLHDKYFMKE